jgi:hypothetical protein
LLPTSTSSKRYGRYFVPNRAASNTLQSSPVMLKEILSVLFQLSFLTPGAAYPLAPLRTEQRTILSALSEFGLVMMPVCSPCKHPF